MSKKVGIFLCPKGGGYANGIQNATLAKIDEAGKKLQNIGSSVENLATFEATKKWTMSIRNWGQVYGELSIMYEGRLPE